MVLKKTDGGEEGSSDKLSRVDGLLFQGRSAGPDTAHPRCTGPAGLSSLANLFLSAGSELRLRKTTSQTDVHALSARTHQGHPSVKRSRNSSPSRWGSIDDATDTSELFCIAFQ